MNDAARRESSRRLFVAIELSEAWKQALASLQRAMQAALLADQRTIGVRVRWVGPEGVHLTLKFLGEVPERRLGAIDAALRSAVPASLGIELAMGLVGSFGDRHAPRVIWAGIAEQGAPGRDSHLLQLVERIETWLQAAGFAREKRSFAPHLTLGRLPETLSPVSREAVAAVTCAVDPPEPALLAVEHVALIQSHLGPGGARYERLFAYPA